MGKVGFISNRLTNRYNFIKSGLEDFFYRFFNGSYKEVALSMLDEISKLDSSIILEGKTNEWIGGIVYSLVEIKIINSNNVISLKRISKYLEIDEETIYNKYLNLKELLNMEMIHDNFFYDDKEYDNELFLGKLNKPLRRILFGHYDMKEFYLEETLAQWIEDFYSSIHFERLSNTEQEYADFVIEVFDVNMYNSIGEPSKQWSVEGIKRCCLEVIPIKVKADIELFNCMGPVLESFFTFLQESKYIENGEKLIKVIKEISDDIIKNVISINNIR